MKKIKSTVVLGFLALSLTVNAAFGRGGSSALKQIAKILVAMQTKQALMQVDL